MVTSETKEWGGLEPSVPRVESDLVCGGFVRDPLCPPASKTWKNNTNPNAQSLTTQPSTPLSPAATPQKWNANKRAYLAGEIIRRKLALKSARNF